MSVVSDVESVGEMAEAAHHQAALKDMRVLKAKYRNAAPMTEETIRQITSTLNGGDPIDVIWAFKSEPRTLLSWSGIVVAKQDGKLQVFYPKTNPSMPHLNDATAAGLVEVLPGDECTYYDIIRQRTLTARGPEELHHAMRGEATQAREQHLQQQRTIEELQRQLNDARTNNTQPFAWYDPATWDERPAETVIMVLRAQLGINVHSSPQLRQYFQHLELFLGAVDGTDWCTNAGFVKLAGSLLRQVRDAIAYGAGYDMVKVRKELATTTTDDPYECALTKAGKMDKKSGKKFIKKCFNCGQEGHLSTNCTSSKNTQGPVSKRH